MDTEPLDEENFVDPASMVQVQYGTPPPPQPTTFPHAILDIPAPRKFVQGYKCGSITAEDAMIPLRLPTEAIRLIVEGLRYLGAQADDFSGIHIAYCTGQISGKFSYAARVSHLL